MDVPIQTFEHLSTFNNCHQIPDGWKVSCANSECTMHQLSPYIGKLKSTIAKSLISTYSKPGDTVVDPFSGSGTIPLEARLQGRHVFASDISPYAGLLSRAKLFPPDSMDEALSQAEEMFNESQRSEKPDLEKVPDWVRKFFHYETLSEAIRFAEVCKHHKSSDFIFACFLGILHHQRPGFLSYPSSHLVPYLRDKKFPREQYPEMYEYRELKPRLMAKVKRAYKRFYGYPQNVSGVFEESSVDSIALPRQFECIITSPPYMNALDYGRDNRLRLWFIDPVSAVSVDHNQSQQKKGFELVLGTLAEKIDTSLTNGGYAIFVVGDEISRSYVSHPSEVVVKIMLENSSFLRLENVFTDVIPDIRRSRRDYRGIKSEHFLVFKKVM